MADPKAPEAAAPSEDELDDLEAEAMEQDAEAAGDEERASFEREAEHRPGERRKEEKWYAVVEAELARLPRPEGKDYRTWAGVFDRRTMMTLYRFLSNDVIASLDFPVSTGKEADVFRATTPEGTFICVKIFRTNTATFHDVLQYIQGDPRFVGIKREKHGLVAAWAQKEYRNLGRAVDAGVRVPQPISCLHNVLLMEYIGTAEGPYPILKETQIEEPEELATRILDDYRRLLTIGRLVHADLSEYNILGTPDGPVIIDIGQAVLLEHPMAEEFFERDVKNLARFLRRAGAKVDVAGVRRWVLGPDYATFNVLLDAKRERPPGYRGRRGGDEEE